MNNLNIFGSAHVPHYDEPPAARRSHLPSHQPHPRDTQYAACLYTPDGYGAAAPATSYLGMQQLGAIGE